MIRRLLVLLFTCASILPAQVKLSTLTRSTVATGLTDSALTLVTDSATRTRAATIANFRKSLSRFAFDSLKSTGLATATGGLTFGANKRLTFAAADTIVGTAFFKDTIAGSPVRITKQNFLNGLTVTGIDSLLAGSRLAFAANDTVYGQPNWNAVQTYPGVTIAANGRLTFSTADSLFGIARFGLGTANALAFSDSAWIIGGSGNGVTIRNSGNTRNNWSMNDAGTTNTINDGTRTLLFALTAGSGEIPDGGILQPSTVSHDGVAISGRSAGTTSTVALTYYDGTQQRSAAQVTNVASGFGTLSLMKTGGGVSIGANSSTTASLTMTGGTTTPAALTATAHIGFPSTVSGASLMGFGTTNDVTMMTDSGTAVAGIPHNKRQFWYLGTATNDTVNTGYTGEYAHHEVAINTTNTLSNGAYTVIDSLTLTGGDWDCTGIGVFRDTSATTTQLRANVDSVRAATSSIYRLSTLPLAFSAAVDTIALPTPTFRMSLTGTQKVYLNLMAMFSTNKVYGSGGLRCRRIR